MIFFNVKEVRDFLIKRILSLIYLLQSTHPLCKQFYYDLGISKVVFPEGDTTATLLISAFSSTSFEIGT